MSRFITCNSGEEQRTTVRKVYKDSMDSEIWRELLRLIDKQYNNPCIEYKQTHEVDV